jgi:hypothetical protein
MSEQLIREVIDSMCFPCAKRLLHFQLFTCTSGSEKTNYYWIIELLREKKNREANLPPQGCGVCFGMLEKFSQTEFLTQV